MWQRGVQTWSLADTFDHILEDTGYSAYINDGSEEGRDRWENILELRRLVYDSSELGLTLFLENLALVSDQDTVPEHTEAPTLLTLHAAKGLEFTRVFIIGLDDGMLPHSRSLDDPEQMAEERRLFYVGITRARDRLTLVRAARRSSYGSYDYSTPSRFLQDIPAALLIQEGAHFGRRAAADPRAHTWTFPSPPGGAAPILEPRYKAGMRVKNAAWGEGMVIDVRLVDGDERIDVFFESVGFKRLLGSIAVLEILG
jgi:DNA helicase-2/ATP-dependent DNA helicase PcrA